MDVTFVHYPKTNILSKDKVDKWKLYRFQYDIWIKVKPKFHHKDTTNCTLQPTFIKFASYLSIFSVSSSIMDNTIYKGWPIVTYFAGKTARRTALVALGLVV